MLKVGGTMLELFDYAVIGLVVVISNLATLFLVYRVAKPRLTKQLRGEAMNIGNQVGKQLSETIENVDVGEILGQLGGEEGGVSGMGQLAGLLGGKGGGATDFMGLLSSFGGKASKGLKEFKRGR